MQIVKISTNNYNFFCPVTGEQIMSEDDYSPSNATVFALLQSCPESVTFATDELSKDFENYCSKNQSKDPEKFEVKWQFLQEHFNNEVVCFAITHRGMACGPVSDTFYLGINMSTILLTN
jgi:hypothetical protein